MCQLILFQANSKLRPRLGTTHGLFPTDSLQISTLTGMDLRI